MSTLGLAQQPPSLEQKLFDLVVGRPAAAENSRAPTDGDGALSPMEKKEPILAKWKVKRGGPKRSEKILAKLMERALKPRKGQPPPVVMI